MTITIGYNGKHKIIQKDIGISQSWKIKRNCKQLRKREMNETAPDVDEIV
jgi:hypothetical protein